MNAIIAFRKTAAPAPSPTTIHDIIEEHQRAVDKLDTRLHQLNDAQWLAGERAALQKKRVVAQREVDILKDVAGPNA
ncbi:MAG TPA: hypothetical protein VGO93_31395 [Candidatus Xenobia bacterium]|jgi:uncharacterized damage-inducible protein DinB